MCAAQSAEWTRAVERLAGPSPLPALAIRGWWHNGPFLGDSRRESFLLLHVPGGCWLLEEPLRSPRLVAVPSVQITIRERERRVVDDADAWSREPTGVIAAPARWFSEGLARPLIAEPQADTVAGRACRRFIVQYSRHSPQSMALWVDDELPLILRAVAANPNKPERPRFELRVTEIVPTAPADADRQNRWIMDIVAGTRGHATPRS